MSLLFEELRKSVAAHPDKTALIEDGVRLTYEDVRDRVIRLSHTLHKMGIQPGDRVALMFMNQKEFLAGFFAILRLGAVAVPINIQLPPEDILYVILNSGSRLVLTTHKFAPNFEGKPIPVLVSNQEGEARFPSMEEAMETGDPDFVPDYQRNPDTMSILMYTSGTTGKPKGVMLSEENIWNNTLGFGDAVQVTETDRMLMALPLFHAYGLTVTLYGFLKGATIALVPNFNPRRILSMVAEEQITVLPLVPTLFSFVAEALPKMGPDMFKSLKVCISGGASLPPALLKQLEETASITILEGYGLTETSPVIAVNRMSRGSIPGSVGLPLSNVDVRLRDDAGSVIEVKPGEMSAIGEIEVKGPNVMLGYYGLPEITAETLTADGWLKTGDLGHFDGEGNLYISGGRKKDLIIKAGENIAPLRIEQVLYQHPAVQDACVFGVPDPKLGEDIFAAVTMKEGQHVDPNELKKFCREHLTPYLTPAYVRIYDELPKNATGKILKKQLQEENRNAATVGSAS